MSNPFDVITHLNTSSLDKWDEHEGSFDSFMTDRAMSYNLVSILYASEMTQKRDVPDKWKYDFYRLAIQPKQKRFAKWSKPITDDRIELLMQAFTCNRRKALEISPLINNEQFAIIMEKLQHGGK